MTDQTAGLGGPEQASPLARIGEAPLPHQLAPIVAARIAAAIAALVLGYYWHAEGSPANILFTAGTTALIAVVIVLATRRALFAAVVTALLIVIIVGIAQAKQSIIGMVLHAYDIVFYLGSWSTLTYLWDGARFYLVALVAALFFAVFAGWWIYRIDGTRVRRSHAAIAAAVVGCLAYAGAAEKGERPHTLFYWENF